MRSGLVPVFIFPFPTPVPDCVFQLELRELSAGKMKTEQIRSNRPQARVVYRMEECTPDQGAANGKTKTGKIRKS